MYLPTDFGLEVSTRARKDEAEALGPDLSRPRPRTSRTSRTSSAPSPSCATPGCDIVATAARRTPDDRRLRHRQEARLDECGSFVGSSAGFNTAVAKVPEGVTEGYYAAAGWTDHEARMDKN
jgi:branched-chain amino acid transport system substrate-binding protein